MKKLAYFDNAATTYPKPESVYAFADEFYRAMGGNLGRGSNEFSKSASTLARETKEALKRLFHCPAKQVVFTASATDALNRILLGMSRTALRCVYVTPFEHNAVVRPLYFLEHERGANVSELAFDRASLLPDLDAIEKQFASASPTLVVLNCASNVCGVLVPVLAIAEVAKRHGAMVVVDMSQTAGLVDIDLSSDLIDFAVFAGHKTLYGPFGIGGFVCDPRALLNPVLFGGNGVNSIEPSMPKDIVQMCEVGSQNIYAIAGLKAALEWIEQTGISFVRERESTNRDRLVGVLSQYENVTIVGSRSSAENVGVVSFLLDGYSPDEVELVLDKYGVAVRSGLHCAPGAHKFLGTLPAGTIRLSVSYFTSEEDFALLEGALDAFCED